jgi:hypothetical protein
LGVCTNSRRGRLRVRPGLGLRCCRCSLHVVTSVESGTCPALDNRNNVPYF